MTRKDKIFNQIVSYLKERKDKVKHDFYLYRGDDCIGKITKVWLDENGTPMCDAWWWGVSSVTPLCEITTRNLIIVRNYLRDGYVIQ